MNSTQKQENFLLNIFSGFKSDFDLERTKSFAYLLILSVARFVIPMGDLNTTIFLKEILVFFLMKK